MSNNSENAGDFFPERPAELDPRPSLSFSPRVPDDSGSGAHAFRGHDGAPCLFVMPDGAHCDSPESSATHLLPRPGRGSVTLGVDNALPVVIDVNTLAQHRRHADLGESAAGCPFCPALIALARGGIVRMVAAEPAHKGSSACRHCAAAIEPYPASGTGWFHALSGLVGCGPKGITISDQRAAEPAPPGPCICRGSATAVCFDAAGVSCPRGALLHAAAYLPTLDELRAQRGKAGQ